MKIKIHVGARQIGGNCIEVSTADTRILLDFGMPLPDKNEKDDENIFKGKSIRHLISEKLLPDIPGLYKDEGKGVDAIFISHSHKDHYGRLKYAHPDIPVYSSYGTKKLIEILNIFIEEDKRVEIKPRVIRNAKKESVGSFIVKPYSVDHSGYDAMSFLVLDTKTNKRIFYSGDFKAGGWKKDSFNKFLNMVRNKKVDYLLMEGTLIDRETGEYNDEQDIVSKVTDIINGSNNKITLAISSGQNIDRIISLYKAMKDTNSILIIDPYIACVLNSIKNEYNNVPKFHHDDNIKVFIANYYGGGDVFVKKIASSQLKYLIPYLGKKKIKPKDLNNIGSKALMIIRDSILPAIENISAVNGANLIYSMWSGYLERDNSLKLKNFIDEHKLKIKHVHTSGHATKEALLQLADAIKPKCLIPIHTSNPDKFKTIFTNHNVKPVYDGEEIVV